MFGGQTEVVVFWQTDLDWRRQDAEEPVGLWCVE